MSGNNSDDRIRRDDGTVQLWLGSVLSLMDSTRFSASYGCFDREYWLYRGKDFPSGMQQSFVLVPALAHAGMAGAALAGNPRLRDAVLAGLAFLERMTKRDGSLDDYYPNERALGAAAHVLFFACEALLALDESHEAFPCLARLARFVSRNGEAGRLANHHAAVAAAQVAYARLRRVRPGPVVADAVTTVLDMQHEEGWFQEYDGADPGYQTMTVGYLSYVWLHSPSERLLSALRRAVAFCRAFLSDDCAYGGELGSRGTTHLNGYGFEILRAHAQGAAELADAAYYCHLVKEHFLKDSRFFGAQAGWAMLAMQVRKRAGIATPAPPLLRNESEAIFPAAGLVRIPGGNSGGVTCFLALLKGGVVKVYRGDELVHAEAALLMDTNRGPAHSQGPSVYRREANSFVVNGTFQRLGKMTFNPLWFMVSRLVMRTVGGRLRDSIRRYAQRRLVSGVELPGYQYEKRITVDGKGVRIRLEVRRHAPDAPVIRRAFVSPDFNARTTATGQTFHQTGLIGLTKLDDIVNHDFTRPYFHETWITA